MKTLRLVPFIFFLLLVRCEDSSQLKTNSISYFINDVLASPKLDELNILERELLVDQAKLIKSPDNLSDILIIPIESNEKNKTEFLASYYKDSKRGLTYKTTIINEPISTPNLSKSFEFTGTLIYTLGRSTFTTLKIVRNIPMVITTKKCGIVEAGACAARTIDEMKTFSYIACIWEIPLCFAILVADCLISDCPWTV